MLRPFFVTGILKIEWGPHNGDLAIYVQGDSKVVIYDPKDDSKGFYFIFMYEGYRGKKQTYLLLFKI